MDTTILVNNKFEEGKELLKLLDNSIYKCPIAYWMFHEERNEWELVFGIPHLKEKGTRDFYSLLQSLIHKNNIHLTLDNVTVKDTSDELLRALRSTIKTSSIFNKIEFFGNYINGKKFPDSIIYRVR